MRQYTTPEQTAKLIELGVERPFRNEYLHIVEEYGYAVNKERNFSIGDLIEMLPQTIIVGCTMTKRLIFSLAFYGWEIGYLGMGMGEPIVFRRAELIDALYDMILKLKEEGVI